MSARKARAGVPARRRAGACKASDTRVRSVCVRARKHCRIFTCVKPPSGNSGRDIDNLLGCQANPKGGPTASEIGHFTEGGQAGRESEKRAPPVSYTHLTLPTIYSV